MKNFRIFISLVCSLTFIIGSAASHPIPEALDTIKVSKAFIHLSEQGLDIIRRTVRQDMVDYMEADSIAKLANIYGGRSWIEEMTNDYMRVHLTDASSLQLRILYTLNKKLPQIVMSIYTVGEDTDAQDSTIRFYDTDFTELPRKNYFSLPKTSDYFSLPATKGAETPSIKDLEQDIPFYLTTYTVSASYPATLTGTLNLKEYLSEEQAGKYTPYLRPALKWIWTGKKFELQGE